MARKSKEELKALEEKYGVDRLWSWSRYNYYKQDPYGYFLRYVLHTKPDRNTGIYGVSGGNVHDILEKFYGGEITYEQMLPLYEDRLFEMNLAELKYHRGDSAKNEKIAVKYEGSIRHFFKNHQKVENDHKLEEFVVIRISDDIVMQGYIDFLEFIRNEDKLVGVEIADWKTSTIYKNEKVLKERGQLLLYSEAIRQLGVPLGKIKAKWNFVKYVEVDCKQANGKMRTRQILRCELGSCLAASVKTWLKRSEDNLSEEELEHAIFELISTNSLDHLPENVKDKFSIRDCYVYIPTTQDAIEALIADIIKTVAEIKGKEEQYKKTHDDSCFMYEVTDKEEYFLANLSDYSRKLHKPYDRYLKEKDMYKDKNEEETEGVDEEFAEFLASL